MNNESDARNTSDRPSARSSTHSATTALSAGSSQQETRDLLPILGNERYQLCDELARGGVGIIYQAKDELLQREVAIKVLRTKYLHDDYALRTFADEAYVMSFLPHPGVPPIYECGVCLDQRPYHVMKLINGVTLAELIRNQSVHQGECFKIFSDVCETLAFAHSHEVVHLDLKPSNIMVGAFGEVHVMDWGLARFSRKVSGKVTISESDPDPSINGTPEYMAPEQARGEQVDARTDVFGLGAILCEILTGRAPYKGNTVKEVYRRAARASLDVPLAALASCKSDPALVRLAKKCLSPRPLDRPKNAIVVAREVAAYQESALERAQSDLARFFELSLDLFCIAGFDGYFRRINSNFSRVLGHTEEELLSRPFLEFVHAQDRSRTIRRMSVLREGQPVVRFRNRYRRSDGQFVTLEWTAKAIEGEEIIFAVARDVSTSQQQKN